MPPPPVSRSLHKRGSKLKPEARLFVESLLATCTPHPVIKAQIAKKFGVGERQAANWIKATYEELAIEARPRQKDERRAQMRAALSDFYQKALLARQFNAAVTALDRLCKLDGLYAPDEVAIKALGGVVERDPDKLRERIRTLAAKMPHLLQPSPDVLGVPTEQSEPTPGEDPESDDGSGGSDDGSGGLLS